MRNIILIGAGGHCKSCIDVIENEKKYKIIGLVDNKKKGIILNYKILGKDYEINKFRNVAKYALITVGQIKNYLIRENLFKKIKNCNFILPTIISPFSKVSKHSLIKEGTIVMHRCIINTHSKIGRNCIINTGAIIEHDVFVGDNCHVSTGVILNGSVTIKKNTFIGSSTIVKNNVTIGKNCIIGMGKIIKKDLKDNSIVK